MRGKLKMETLSLHPPIFRVAKFLTPKETDWHVHYFKEQQLVESVARFESNHVEKYEEASMSIQGALQLELAHNAVLPSFNVLHVRTILREIYDIPKLNMKYTRRVVAALDANGDTKVDKGEWENKTVWPTIDAVMHQVKREHPEFYTRFSRQAWIPKATKRVTSKMAALLGIPLQFIKEQYHINPDTNLFGEQIQVVKYTENGHYTAHHDSSHNRVDKDSSTAPLQRAYTVLIYLRDLPEDSGGETWFPGSGVDPTGAFDEDMWNDLEQASMHNSTCVSKKHGGSGILVNSKRGDAIVWMNHKDDRNRNSGPFGINAMEGWQPMDMSTVHSGCDVKRRKDGLAAEKWIANQWVWKHSLEKLCEIRNGDVVHYRERRLSYRGDEDEDENERGDEDGRRIHETL